MISKSEKNTIQRSELSYDCEESEVGRGSRVRAGWCFWSYLERKTPMVRVKRWTAKKKNNTPSFVFHPRSKKITALNNNSLIFIILIPFRGVTFSFPKTLDLLEAVSKIGFWFKIAAGLSFPAKRDFPPDPVIFVGRKPEAYCCMSRIWNEAPTKILGQKTFLRWLLVLSAAMPGNFN